MYYICLTAPFLQLRKHIVLQSGRGGVNLLELCKTHDSVPENKQAVRYPFSARRLQLETHYMAVLCIFAYSFLYTVFAHCTPNLPSML